ncbi:hypothetical protein ACFQXA_00710 [Nocardiopsis composta]
MAWRGGGRRAEGVRLPPRRRPRPLPGLLADLQRDRAALEKLAASSLGGRVYAKEVDRLVRRHGGTSEEAEALVEMGRTESERGDSGDGRLVPVEAARVALFLRREAW